MAKKLLLIFGTLAILVVALVVYSHYVASDLPALPEPAADERPEIPAGTTTVGGVPVGAAGEVWLAQTDPETGLRTAVIRGRSWHGEGDRYTLVEPDAELYLPGGQTIRITAAKGVIRAEEVAGTLEPREGRMTGEVCIRVDMNTLRDDQRPPAAERPADFVHVYTEEVTFSEELQEILAPGRVEVTGQDVRILGEHLLLQWHTAPVRELRRLLLARGETIEIRRAAEPVGRRDDDDRTPAAAPGPVVPAAEPAVVRAYRLTMTDTIEVHRRSQHLEGADDLTLLFAFRDDSETRQMSPSPRQARQAASETSTAPAEAIDGGETFTITWAGPLEMVPVTDATDLGGMTMPPAGEFALAAVGPALTLTDEQIDEQTGQPAGENVVARCGRASFNSATETVDLAAGDRPGGAVDLTIAELGQLTGRAVRLNDRDQTIALEGDGELLLDTGGETAPRLLTTRRPSDAAAAPPSAPGEADGRITWQDGVTVRYIAAASRRMPVSATFQGDVRFTSADGALMDGQVLIAMFAETAGTDEAAAGETRVGSAALAAVYGGGSTRLVSADGRQAIGGDWLEIPFRRTDEGRTVPRHLYALGDVAATLDDDDIAADELLLEFDQEPQAANDDPAIEAVAMRAWGDVRLTREDAPAPMTVRGEVFDGDLAAGRYTITGRPAEVEVDGQWVRGGRIVLTGERIGETLVLKEAAIDTAGIARLMIEQDFSGADLDEPRPGYVQWDDRMTFRPGADEVVFAGNVRFDAGEGMDERSAGSVALDSPGDHLRCDTLTASLADTEAPGEAAPTTQVADDALLSMGRELRGLSADGRVRLLSRRDDKDGHPVGRMKLEAGKLDWNAVATRVAVDGAGTLSLEDYRPPSATDGRTAGVDRPSQTVFAWREGMDLAQTRGTAVEVDAPAADVWEVTMAGEVRMTHRSGRQVVGLDKLPGFEPETLSEGRTTELDCRELIARLASRTPSDGTDAAGGLSQDLELFQAIGGVVLREGPYEAQGGQIVYDDTQETVVIYGGEDPAVDSTTPARVYYDPPGHREPFDTVSPAIRVRRVGHRYEVHAVRAAGGGVR